MKRRGGFRVALLSEEVSLNMPSIDWSSISLESLKYLTEGQLFNYDGQSDSLSVNEELERVYISLVSAIENYTLKPLLYLLLSTTEQVLAVHKETNNAKLLELLVLERVIKDAICEAEANEVSFIRYLDEEETRILEEEDEMQRQLESDVKDKLEVKYNEKW